MYNVCINTEQIKYQASYLIYFQHSFQKKANKIIQIDGHLII